MDDTRTATTTKECTIYSNWTVIVLEEVSTDSMLTLEPRKLASLGGCKTKANIGTGDFFFHQRERRRDFSCSYRA